MDHNPEILIPDTQGPSVDDHPRMTKLSPKARTAEKRETPIEMQEFRIPIKHTFIARISAHANSHHIRLPRDLLEFYDLHAGDQLKIEVTDAKGERPVVRSE